MKTMNGKEILSAYKRLVAMTQHGYAHVEPADPKAILAASGEQTKMKQPLGRAFMAREDGTVLSVTFTPQRVIETGESVNKVVFFTKEIDALMAARNALWAASADRLIGLDENIVRRFNELVGAEPIPTADAVLGVSDDAGPKPDGWDEVAASNSEAIGKIEAVEPVAPAKAKKPAASKGRGLSKSGVKAAADRAEAASNAKRTKSAKPAKKAA